MPLLWSAHFLLLLVHSPPVLYLDDFFPEDVAAESKAVSNDPPRLGQSSEYVSLYDESLLVAYYFPQRRPRGADQMYASAAAASAVLEELEASAADEDKSSAVSGLQYLYWFFMC